MCVEEYFLPQGIQCILPSIPNSNGLFPCEECGETFAEMVMETEVKLLDAGNKKNQKNLIKYSLK